jgi:hypothetical protein
MTSSADHGNELQLYAVLSAASINQQGDTPSLCRSARVSHRRELKVCREAGAISQKAALRSALWTRSFGAFG